jgi:hypothetical protein
MEIISSQTPVKSFQRIDVNYFDLFFWDIPSRQKIHWDINRVLE